MVRVVIPLILVGMLVFAIADILAIGNNRVRGIPKFGWIVLVVLVPLVGPLLWFLLGRDRSGGRDIDDGTATTWSAPRPARRVGPVAPDDDPEFLGRLSREQQQEDRIRELERRLSELGDGKPGVDDKPES